jgi:hypothetical protein
MSLLDQGTREDVPTGKTPRKGVWEYANQWQLTEGGDNVVRAWQERGTSDSANKTELYYTSPRCTTQPDKTISLMSGSEMRCMSCRMSLDTFLLSFQISLRGGFE